MKKKALALILALMVLSATGITALANGTATVSFTENKTLEYSNVTVEDGVVNLGSAFEDVVPGETREQIITVKNDNKHTADFYISAQVLKALEESKDAAKGAGYDIVLKAGDTVLYDSTVGGYNAGQTASDTGIGEMNDALEDYVLFATLKNGEAAEVVLSISFDGEAMDNSGAIDYSSTIGQIAFDFKAGYEEPTGKTVIVKEVTEDGEITYVKKVVEIIEERVPLGAVPTGDGAMIGLAVAVLVLGMVLLFVGKKKKVEEEA